MEAKMNELVIEKSSKVEQLQRYVVIREVNFTVANIEEMLWKLIRITI